MKISKIIALSLTMASAQALAFQAKETQISAPSQEQLKTAENALIGNFYNPHGVRGQASASATCAAVPVAGCGCPFCTQLRSRA
ncbi:hypothetical protein [Erwinia sp. S38]|uniref:hypothetical protein n=1 Tax=Erwinia sp. S38 TaxID=2769338 RepID=UPI00190C85D4|nr:hypothetical protein [Erwinia sp. S38]MBK0002924.1 hypothetical protein [Erwinia sp. S38]